VVGGGLPPIVVKIVYVEVEGGWTVIMEVIVTRVIVSVCVTTICCRVD
jgi:hypothetical protein